MKTELRGTIYENGKSEVINLIDYDCVKLQSEGTGEYQVHGKMQGCDDYHAIALIRSGDFSIKTSADDNDMYTADVTACDFIKIVNAVGIDKVNFVAFNT